MVKSYLEYTAKAISASMTIIAVGAVMVLLPITATAQVPIVSGGFDIQRFKPAKDSRGFFMTGQSAVLSHLDFNANAYMNFARNPLELSIPGDGARIDGVVDGITTMDLSVALGLFNVLSIAVGMPITMNQDRTGLILPEDGSNSGFNDIGIDAKFKLLDRQEEFVGVAVLASLTLPTGNAKRLFGAGSVTAEGNVIADFQPTGDLVIATNLGYRYRNEVVEFGRVVVDDELTAKIGAGYRLDRFEALRKWEVIAEAFGSTVVKKAFKKERSSPIEVLAGMRRYTDEGFTFNVGVGAGLTRGIGAPDYRALMGLTFHPFAKDPGTCELPPPVVENTPSCAYEGPEDLDGFEDDDQCPDPDNDGDGILDVDDGAPFEAEDKDGFRDDDGVPDFDNDGDGIDEPGDQCPDEAEDFDHFEDHDGCPEEGTPEGDAAESSLLSSETPPCIFGPEDMDGFEDHDGCADPDNDGDNIADAADKCPLVAEDLDGFEDEDGCPEKGEGKAVLVGKKIEILDRVYFKTASAKINIKKSAPVLDAVATILRENEWIKTIEIQGHTDNRGAAAYNRRLSQDRAAEVMTYLAEKGITATRLRAKGFGPDLPLESNNTAKGRAANRRVEFVVLDGDNADVELKKQDSRQVVNDEAE